MNEKTIIEIVELICVTLVCIMALHSCTRCATSNPTLTLNMENTDGKDK